MREVVLDTETTGISVTSGDRIIEIGCVELEDRLPTGKEYHAYINPGEVTIPEEVVQLTGLNSDFLKGFPGFEEQAEALIDFLQDSPLVIHNAPFDIGFLNAEFRRMNRPEFSLSRAVDTLLMARRKFPGAPASLDALAKRFNVHMTRAKHGALLDAQILVEVYIELTGGRQRAFTFDEAQIVHEEVTKTDTRCFPRRYFPPSQDELKAFENMLTKLQNPMWRMEIGEG